MLSPVIEAPTPAAEAPQLELPVSAKNIPPQSNDKGKVNTLATPSGTDEKRRYRDPLLGSPPVVTPPVPDISKHFAVAAPPSPLLPPPMLTEILHCRRANSVAEIQPRKPAIQPPPQRRPSSGTLAPLRLTELHANAPAANNFSGPTPTITTWSAPPSTITTRTISACPPPPMLPMPVARSASTIADVAKATTPSIAERAKLVGAALSRPSPSPSHATPLRDARGQAAHSPSVAHLARLVGAALSAPSPTPAPANALAPPVITRPPPAPPQPIGSGAVVTAAVGPRVHRPAATVEVPPPIAPRVVVSNFATPISSRSRPARLSSWPALTPTSASCVVGGAMGVGAGGDITVDDDDDDGVAAIRSCEWLDTAHRTHLLAWLHGTSDAVLARRAREGDESIDSELLPAGETLLVVPDKAMLLRPTALGSSPRALGGGGAALALELEEDSTCITRLYNFAHALPRQCLFVGDSILAVDDEAVHCAQDLIEVLEEKPSGAPLILRLRQPALRAALRARGTERVRFAAWVRVANTPGAQSNVPMGSDARASSRRASEKLDEVLISCEGEMEKELAARFEEEDDAGIERKGSGARVPHTARLGERAGGSAGENEGMAVVVVCGQRLRLIDLSVHGTRRGVLRPEKVGTLEKQGEPGRLSLHKWRTRHFELRKGSLYYYDPDDHSRPKGVIPLAYPGVEVLADGHKEASDPRVFVVCTPLRHYALRAPDAAGKDEWVASLRERIGRSEAPLRHLEVVTATVREDVHLLDWRGLASSDQLRSNITLTAIAGAIQGDGCTAVSPSEPSPGLAVYTPLARDVALQLQAAWQRLTTFFGVPPRGCERLDRWLQPRSELAALPILPCDLVWRPAHVADSCMHTTSARACDGDGASRPLAAQLMHGWMYTKPQLEDGVAWRHASVQRHFCVLTHDSLRCYASEDDAVADAANEAIDTVAPTTPRRPDGTMSVFAVTPTPPAARPPQTPLSVASVSPTGDTLSLRAVELCRVTRVRPCDDPSAASHAFELRSLGEGGHELTVVFAPLDGHEAADAWLTALAGALPAAAFEAPRAGRLGWNYFADPLRPEFEACTHHPLAIMSPADELACALLTLADWHGIHDAANAATALRAAISGGATAAIDLCQRCGHAWTEDELTLVLTALVHNARVTRLCLRGFTFGGPASPPVRALAAVLERSACLEGLELSNCTFDEPALGLWTSRILANPKLPLRAISIVACAHLPRSCTYAGECLARVLRALPSALVELELDGAGVTGSSLRRVLDALHRHDRRFLTLRSLRRLTLNSDTLDHRQTHESLCSLLRRASGLRQLRLLRADRTPADSAASTALGSGAHFDNAATGSNRLGCGSSSGGWFGPPAARLAPILAALHASAPPLESLCVDGCAIAPGDEHASLALLRVATRFERLHHLSLGGTRLPVDAICAVAAILVHNNARPPLSLDCARNALGEIGGLKLAAVLRGAVSLRALELADNELGPAGVCAVANSLRGVRSLTALGLARNIRTPAHSTSRAAALSLADDDHSPFGGNGIVDVTHLDEEATDARGAFRAIGRLLSDERCALRLLDIGGDPCTHALADAVTPLLMTLANCPTLTSANVSGHAAHSAPGVLGALLHLLRTSRSMRSLTIHRNGFDAASLRAILGGWRRRNLTLRSLALFAADPRVAGRAALDHEAASARAVAEELLDEAELLARRNRRIANALAEVEVMA